LTHEKSDPEYTYQRLTGVSVCLHFWCSNNVTFTLVVQNYETKRKKQGVY